MDTLVYEQLTRGLTLPVPCQNSRACAEGLCTQWAPQNLHEATTRTDLDSSLLPRCLHILTFRDGTCKAHMLRVEAAASLPGPPATEEHLVLGYLGLAHERLMMRRRAGVHKYRHMQTRTCAHTHTHTKKKNIKTHTK